MVKLGTPSLYMHVFLLPIRSWPNFYNSSIMST